jgi:hypothetical protein
LLGQRLDLSVQDGAWRLRVAVEQRADQILAAAPIAGIEDQVHIGQQLGRPRAECVDARVYRLRVAQGRGELLDDRALARAPDLDPAVPGDVAQLPYGTVFQDLAELVRQIGAQAELAHGVACAFCIVAVERVRTADPGEEEHAHVGTEAAEMVARASGIHLAVLDADLDGKGVPIGAPDGGQERRTIDRRVGEPLVAVQGLSLCQDLVFEQEQDLLFAQGVESFAVML